MKARLFCVLFALGAFSPLKLQAAHNGVIYQIPSAEYNALVDLYNQAGGPGWLDNYGWLDPNASGWFGVHIRGVQYDSSNNVVVQGYVFQLGLQNNELSGTVPSSLGNLPQLQGLGLDGNEYLSGSIPSSLGNLSQLQYLWLMRCHLSGSIPPSLGNLSQLQQLYLDNNQLTGSIPDSLGNLSALQRLSLCYNLLSGTIPSSLGNLSQLQGLWLDGNQLSGSIPASLGNLSQLLGLYLLVNQLSGSIPASLGNLSQLQYLYLGCNQLSGSIPPSLASLSQLRRLALGGNQLTGSIPDSLGNLSAVQELSLDGNQLSGSIPPSLGSLSQLQVLGLCHNQLSGDVPIFQGPLSPFYGGACLCGNWLEIDPGTQSRANIDQMIAAGKRIYYTPQNGVTVTPLRLAPSQTNVKGTDLIDDPITPVTDPNNLSAASPLGKGVVADDVTPVLFQFNGTTTSYTIQITHDAFSYNGALSGHLFVLQGGAWTPTTNLTIYSASSPGYAYLSGLTWTDFLGTPASGVTVTVSVYLPGGSTPVASTSFMVRPPPLILVHGYNADAGCWFPGFKSVLAVSRPADFIRAINYGTADNNAFNRAGSFFDLLPELDAVLAAEESNLRADWAFTRYDVVGHSQGGVLLRMLCQNFPRAPAIVGANNFYRGRFRRVITIGSPHNGSVLLRYLLYMRYSGDPITAHIPDIIGKLIQKKFDPFGWQVEMMNDSYYRADSRIKFHCIRTTVDDGLPPQPNINTAAERLLGLCQARADLGGSSVGQLSIPRGYDSIVDYDSQGGGPGTPVTTMPNSVANPANIAHAAVTAGFPLLPGGGLLFGVTIYHGQTTDVTVASKVDDLLNGPASNLGPFILPPPLPNTLKDLIDQVIPKSSVAGAIVALMHPADLSTNYDYGLQTTPPLATNAQVTWFAQVFGTNGISSDGIALVVNSNNTSQATISVTNGLTGTVVLYASYFGTNGNLVFANPLVVVSYPPGTTLNGIELAPTSANMSVGDVPPTSIWGDYTNGTRCLLYVPDGQASYSSSNTNVATVSTNGIITVNSLGSATITASYQGFTAQTVVSSAATSIRDFYGSLATNGLYQLNLYSSVGTTNIIMASTNLVDWSTAATIYNTNGLIQFQDTNTMSRRFYRAQLSP
jgi:pimeloyl-ACP methyl ester carboxylesterase